MLKMDTGRWKNLLLSWANVLQICDEELNTIEDFVTSDFFPRLVCKLDGKQAKNVRSIECASNFLKGIYPLVVLDTSQLNENHLIAAATLFMVHCSLNMSPRDQELQEKVCSLPHDQQCLLKSLLEKFITIEKSSVTKEMIIANIELLDLEPGQGGSGSNSVGNFSSSSTTTIVAASPMEEASPFSPGTNNSTTTVSNTNTSNGSTSVTNTSTTITSASGNDTAAGTNRNNINTSGSPTCMREALNRLKREIHSLVDVTKEVWKEVDILKAQYKE